MHMLIIFGTVLLCLAAGPIETSEPFPCLPDDAPALDGGDVLIAPLTDPDDTAMEAYPDDPLDEPLDTDPIVPLVTDLPDPLHIALDTLIRDSDFDRVAGPYDEYHLVQDDRSLVFFANSRRLIHDGTVVWLNSPTLRTNGRWYISGADVESVWRPLIRPASVLRRYGADRILLDPGHGGRDPGAVVGEAMEKDLTLDIALRTADHLNRIGIRAMLTRDSDSTLSLAERVTMARQLDADLFVSIHVNKASSVAARGVESFVMPVRHFPVTASTTPDSGLFAGNEHDAANTLLGVYVHTALRKASGTPDRGLRRSRFRVLRDAPCPAVMVECGFLSNAGDARLLETVAYRDRIAAGIATGIAAYVDAVLAAREPGD